MRSKLDRVRGRRMEEEHGVFILCGRGCEHGVVAVWMKAANDFGTGRPVDAQALAADRDAVVGIDPGAGALAPDAGPPWAARGGAQGGAFLAQGKVPGRLRGGADLAMLVGGNKGQSSFLDYRQSRKDD